jgi:hypothetical protein
MSMLNMPTTVLIGFYFRRRRSLATSITKCGVGVGAVIYPPLVTHFLAQYGLRGSLLLCGGISLNTLAAALLLRPIAMYKRKDKDDCNKLRGSQISVHTSQASISSNSNHCDDKRVPGTDNARVQTAAEARRSCDSFQLNHDRKVKEKMCAHSDTDYSQKTAAESSQNNKDCNKHATTVDDDNGDDVNDTADCANTSIANTSIATEQEKRSLLSNPSVLSRATCADQCKTETRSTCVEIQMDSIVSACAKTGERSRGTHASEAADSHGFQEGLKQREKAGQQNLTFTNMQGTDPRKIHGERCYHENGFSLDSEQSLSKSAPNLFKASVCAESYRKRTTSFNDRATGHGR